MSVGVPTNPPPPPHTDTDPPLSFPHPHPWTRWAPILTGVGFCAVVAQSRPPSFCPLRSVPLSPTALPAANDHGSAKARHAPTPRRPSARARWRSPLCSRRTTRGTGWPCRSTPSPGPSSFSASSCSAPLRRPCRRCLRSGGPIADAAVPRRVQSGRPFAAALYLRWLLAAG